MDNVALIAERDLRLDGGSVKHGQTFEAESADGTIMVGLGMARRAPAEAQAEVQAAVAERVKRKYTRRDMQPQAPKRPYKRRDMQS